MDLNYSVWTTLLSWTLDSWLAARLGCAIQLWHLHITNNQRYYPIIWIEQYPDGQQTISVYTEQDWAENTALFDTIQNAKPL